MNFHIVTLFPEAFTSYFNQSILKRAQDSGVISFYFYNPRDFTNDPHKRIDQKPYGGGPGMVIQAEPVIKAIAKAIGRKKKILVVWLTPGGKDFTNTQAHKFAAEYKDIVFICGRYEGIDARVKEVFSVTEVSIGQYVITGGELAAMVIVDAISRQVEGVLGDPDSVEENRIASHNVYTRPETFIYKKKKYSVPDVLLSGHHKEIEEWKKNKKT